MSLQLVCTLPHTHTLHTLSKNWEKQQNVVCIQKSDIVFTKSTQQIQNNNCKKSKKKSRNMRCLKRLDIKGSRESSAKLDHSVGHSRNPIKCASSARPLEVLPAAKFVVWREKNQFKRFIVMYIFGEWILGTWDETWRRYARFYIAMLQAWIEERLETKMYRISNTCQGKTSLNLDYALYNSDQDSFGSLKLIT